MSASFENRRLASSSNGASGAALLADFTRNTRVPTDGWMPEAGMPVSRLTKNAVTCDLLDAAILGDGEAALRAAKHGLAEKVWFKTESAPGLTTDTCTGIRDALAKADRRLAVSRASSSHDPASATGNTEVFRRPTASDNARGS